MTESTPLTTSDLTSGGSGKQYFTLCRYWRCSIGWNRVLCNEEIPKAKNILLVGGILMGPAFIAIPI
jgi:hypothetical protein